MKDEFTEPDFIDKFIAQRPKVFNDFVVALKATNRGYLLNNFNLKDMSLPMEYSIQNNMWCVQALYMQLDFFEKEEKFNQML